jgi:mRNA interferase RelE/StbE
VTEPEAPIEYRIQLTPLALEMLAEVNDQRHREGLTNRIEKLKSEPEKQGKPLGDILKGYRSVRAVGERYRIIYKVDRNLVVVLVVGVGLRRQGNKSDIYATIERLLQE